MKKYLITILLLSLLPLLMSTKSNTQLSRNTLDWQGHRGARGLFPENTIVAMEQALKFPITTLELDVVISKDNMVVVSHEPWMSEEICVDAKGRNVKDREYNLYQMTYEEIKSFDCGSKIHPRFKDQVKIKSSKPTLSDLILAVEKTNKTIFYNIEIKSTSEDEVKGFQPPVQEFTDLVVKTLDLHLGKKRYSLQSFDWRVLDYLSEKYPSISRVALIEGPYVVETALKKFKTLPQVFSPHYEQLSLEDVKFLHNKKIKVIPWTVNDIDSMKKMILLGVDGIITDYPNLIEKL